MAKVISQEFFDDVVKENIVEFSMTAAEAKEETIKQFEAQGINLANIIKDLSINEETGVPIINEAIESLKSHVSSGQMLEEKRLLEVLDTLTSECEESVPHRVLASKSGAMGSLIHILKTELNQANPNQKLLLKAVAAAGSLTNKQPDIFDDETLDIIRQILTNYQNNEELVTESLQWLAKACVMHEINRQNIINADIINHLKPIVASTSQRIIKEMCVVFRYLILDDDIRVEFGKAHEHARIIASEVLTDLTKLLAEFTDVHVLSELLLTIASLTVRHEFCLAVEEAGGLKLVFELLNKYPESVKISREALKLLRALAGHDTVKAHIVQQGAAPIIQNILSTHKSNETLAKVGLVCISTLTLRVKDNSAAFFEAGIPETIVATMKLHPKSKPVQRNGAWAIRNMVSRSRDQCESFLSHGVEDVLNAAMRDHASINQDLKAALRDLGCKVELKEEWTGKSEIKITN